MNTETAIHTAEHAVERFVGKAETLARQEPARAVTVALLAGLVLNILPTRFLVAGATAVTLTLLRPALLTLGAIKAFELCTAQTQHKQTP